MKGVVDVLPLTPTAHTEIRTGGFYSPGRRFDNLPQAPHGIALLLFNNFNPDLLIFERIRDEDHFTVRSPNPVSFMGHGFDVDLCLLHFVKNSTGRKEIQFHPEIGEEKALNKLTSFPDFVSFTLLLNWWRCSRV